VTHRFPLTALDAKDTVEAPDLAVSPSGRVFLTWASKTARGEKTIFLTRSGDAGRSFAAPRAVAKAGVYKTRPRSGKGGGYERRATPHGACTGGTFHLAWGEALPDGSGMRMVVRTSADGGETFGPPRLVHRGERAKPTFAAMTVSPAGAKACAWLDDRSGRQQPFASVCPAGADDFGPEQLVYAGQEDSGVCPCCPTAACFANDGTLYVAFRNIHDGYRDIAVARLLPGRSHWEGPFPVSADAWKFDGCPHDGPSLAVVGDVIHVAWMDARGGPRRCYHGRAKRSDLAFEVRELHPEGAGEQGCPRLCPGARGGLHAVWEESTGVAPPAAGGRGHAHGAPTPGSGASRAIFHAQMRPGKDCFGPARPVGEKKGAFQSRPAVVAAGDGTLFVAWNELDESGKAVVVTRLAQEAREPSGRTAR
jgi:hypothetical protein